MSNALQKSKNWNNLEFLTENNIDGYVNLNTIYIIHSVRLVLTLIVNKHLKQSTNKKKF